MLCFPISSGFGTLIFLFLWYEPAPAILPSSPPTRRSSSVGLLTSSNRIPPTLCLHSTLFLVPPGFSFEGLC